MAMMRPYRFWIILRRTARVQRNAPRRSTFLKNSQIAVLSIVILLGALIVAGSNWWLVRSLKNEANGAASNGPSTDPSIVPSTNSSSGSISAGDPAAPSRTIAAATGRGASADLMAGKRITIAMMPKSKGNAYFLACQRGAAEAARQLNVNLLWDGPREPDPAKQNEIVETWMTRGV